MSEITGPEFKQLILDELESVIGEYIPEDIFDTDNQSIFSVAYHEKRDDHFPGNLVQVDFQFNNIGVYCSFTLAKENNDLESFDCFLSYYTGKCEDKYFSDDVSHDVFKNVIVQEMISRF